MSGTLTASLNVPDGYSLHQLTPDSGENSIEQVAKLFDGYRGFYKQPSDVSSALTFLLENLKAQRSLIYYINNQNDDAVAFVQLYHQTSSVGLKRDLILNDLFVDEIERGNGLGPVLVNFVMNFAAKNSIRQIVLETAPDNHGAKKLYESLKWTSSGHLNSDGYCQYVWQP